MEIHFEEQDGLVVIKPTGNLNVDTAKEFVSQLKSAVEQKKNHRVILDFARLDYVSSAGIQAIYNVQAAVQKNDGKMVICRVNQDIIRVFNMIDLQEDIEIYDELDQAISALAES